MARFAVGQKVTVRPESSASAVTTDGAGRPVREHLACATGEVVAGGRIDMGIYAVRFDLMYGTVVRSMDARDLEA